MSTEHKLRGVFVTGTGTGVGKTVVAAKLCRLLVARGVSVLGLKPIETGVTGEPEDAATLANASGRSTLAHVEGFYRAKAPLAPYGATLAGEAGPDLERIVRTVYALARETPQSFCVVEGAGGPLVPVDAKRDVIDLCRALGLPALVVSRDTLGTLSHTLSACEAIHTRGVELLGVALNRWGPRDPSQAHNRQILQARLGLPVWRTEELHACLNTFVNEASLNTSG